MEPAPVASAASRLVDPVHRIEFVPVASLGSAPVDLVGETMARPDAIAQTITRQWNEATFGLLDPDA
jgi:hypothetical protein